MKAIQTITGWLTCRETAQRWGVKVRAVQAQCSAGRVPGAARFQRAWMVPATAERPADRREREAQSVAAQASVTAPPFNGLFLLESIRLGTGTPPGASLTGPARKVLAAELALNRNETDRAARLAAPFVGDPQFALSACIVSCVAAIRQGDQTGFRQTMGAFARYRDGTHGEQQTALGELAVATIMMSLYASNECPAWLRDCNLKALPRSSRAFALYLHCKYLHATGRRERMLGVASAAQESCVGDGFTIPWLYLGILRAVALIESGDSAPAQTILRGLIRSALPYGIVTPFAEHLQSLRGELEPLIAREFPGQLRTVRAAWTKTAAGWTAFHNHVARDKVTDQLTLRQSQTILYAADGLSYKEIAARMGISAASVKSLLRSARDKLGLTRSKDLPRHTIWTFPDQR